MPSTIGMHWPAILLWFFFFLQLAHAQELAGSYKDPDGRFMIFYPSGWEVNERTDMFSSTDVAFIEPNSTNPIKISITYIINNSMLNHTDNEKIVAEKDLATIENQQKPAFKQYNLMKHGSPKYSIYGVPTASHIIDYSTYSGESGRILNVLGIVNGKSSFLLSYTNSKEAFYKTLPIAVQMLNSILILK
jgi:hypothetical protein